MKSILNGNRVQLTKPIADVRLESARVRPGLSYTPAVIYLQRSSVVSSPHCRRDHVEALGL